MIVAVIVVGVPLQFAVGAHATVALATFVASASSLTSAPFRQYRRSSELETWT